jgi:hypothetical protein
MKRFTPDAYTLREALAQAEQHFGYPCDAKLTVHHLSDARTLVELEWIEREHGGEPDKLICMWPRCRTTK